MQWRSCGKISLAKLGEWHRAAEGQSFQTRVTFCCKSPDQLRYGPVSLRLLNGDPNEAVLFF